MDAAGKVADRGIGGTGSYVTIADCGIGGTGIGTGFVPVCITQGTARGSVGTALRDVASTGAGLTGAGLTGAALTRRLDGGLGSPPVRVVASTP